jgi:hypothetical protein
VDCFAPSESALSKVVIIIEIYFTLSRSSQSLVDCFAPSESALSKVEIITEIYFTLSRLSEQLTLQAKDSNKSPLSIPIYSKNNGNVSMNIQS